MSNEIGKLTSETLSVQQTPMFPVYSEAGWYDVVVIGGGAAGLSGALALVRARRKVLVIDEGQPRNAPASHMHNYLSRDGTPPHELLALGRDEVKRYGGQITTGQVAAIKPLDNQELQRGFQVVLSNNSRVYARRLLVASGLVDQLPDLPGIAERWGRDVLHCPYCHGWEVQEQAIGILATGPLTVHQALLFRQLSSDLVVFQHTAPQLAEAHLEELTARGITIIQGEVAALEVQDDRLIGVRLRSGEFIPRQVIVVAPRFVARARFLETLGLETREQESAGYSTGNYVVSDPTGATSVPGIWVAGNVTDLAAQVITAAAAGLKAGAAINLDLVTEETAQAVAALRTQKGKES